MPVTEKNVLCENVKFSHSSVFMVRCELVNPSLIAAMYMYVIYVPVPHVIDVPYMYVI
mgnify:CR=1 FL=1